MLSGRAKKGASGGGKSRQLTSRDDEVADDDEAADIAAAISANLAQPQPQRFTTGTGSGSKPSSGPTSSASAAASDNSAFPSLAGMYKSSSSSAVGTRSSGSSSSSSSSSNPTLGVRDPKAAAIMKSSLNKGKPVTRDMSDLDRLIALSLGDELPSASSAAAAAVAEHAPSPSIVPLPAAGKALKPHEKDGEDEFAALRGGIKPKKGGKK